MVLWVEPVGCHDDDCCNLALLEGRSGERYFDLSDNWVNDGEHEN